MVLLTPFTSLKIVNQDFKVSRQLDDLQLVEALESGCPSLMMLLSSIGL